MLRDLFALPIPAGGDCRLASPDLSEATPAALRSDSFLTFEDGGREYGVILEVQLQPDPGKLLTWPWYITSGRAREGCPVCLVVLCPTRQVAAWAARPIETGRPGLTLRPLVIGPDSTPVITDLRQAIGNIGLAAIAAITHDRLRRSTRSSKR